MDLEGLRSKLDEQGLGIAERQDAARKSRAALAERTKEFRRGGAPEAVKAVGPLLKAYQEEVDRLTARAKRGGAQATRPHAIHTARPARPPLSF